MASNSVDDEKPNLRPTKYSAATGKTLFLHHNPNQPSNKSYIIATWEDRDQQQDELANHKPDPFGIEQPNVEYSLNKRQRWKVLKDFRQQIPNLSSSSSDDDLGTQSDSEQRQKNKKTQQKYLNIHRTKYVLYEFHNNRKKNNCVGITTNTTQRRTQKPRKTYLNESINTVIEPRENHQNNNTESVEVTSNVSYCAVVPLPRESQLANVKKHHTSRNKNTKSSTQRSKFTQANERLDAEERIQDEQEDLSTDDANGDDDDESMLSYYTSSKLELNDFIRVKRDENDIDQVSVKSENSEEVEPSKQKKRFYRQISKEEKLYNRDMATYIKMQEKPGVTIKPKEKSHHHLMSLSFRSIFLHQTDLCIEHLSKTCGKNFLRAQCYPTKYLICLTDRLKYFQWSNKFDLFSIYSTLNCYLVIILNDELNNENNSCQAQVALNMDLYADTIQIETLSQSSEKIYKIDELIDKTIEFVTNLPFDTFKPIDLEINQKKYYRNEIDSELSESEFVNKQIQHIHILDKNDLQAKLNNEEVNNENNLVRPDICVTCCCDMNESIPMTALKSCGHWLCNQCWKQYIETTVKSIKIIRCPEWNCYSHLDVGTILSLVNIRCMNIYERNIEKCLVNLSRSYVKCPSKSCPLIVQVIDSGMDHVRCRCGHQFCIDCKQEPHFPARCSSYREYIDEVYRNGDLTTEYNAKILVRGRNCVSCNYFIEKNGGCNHMTCRCGAQFCWVCTGYWKDHFGPRGEFACPKHEVPIQKKLLVKERNPSRRLYEHAVFHRYERAFQSQVKLNENVKRLIGTIPLEKGTSFDTSLIKSQIDKRESLLRHTYEMVKYVNYLHRVCEFIAVAADGYADNPIEFANSLYPFEAIIFNMTVLFETGRGYQAIEQLNDSCKRSESLLERLRRAVSRRKTRQQQIGYVTS
ncbi:unnamed protein product [Rotaria socialis]